MVLRFCSIIADVQCAAECIMHVYYYALRTNEGEKTNAEYKLGSNFKFYAWKKDCTRNAYKAAWVLMPMDGLLWRHTLPRKTVEAG